MKHYCKPYSADILVARRLGKLIKAMELINSLMVSGEIVEDLRAFRLKLITRLEAEGWTINFRPDTPSLRGPNHKRPYGKGNK